MADQTYGMAKAVSKSSFIRGGIYDGSGGIVHFVPGFARSQRVDTGKLGIGGLLKPGHKLLSSRLSHTLRRKSGSYRNSIPLF